MLLTPPDWPALSARIGARLADAPPETAGAIVEKLGELFAPWLTDAIDAAECSKRLGTVLGVHAARTSGYAAARREATAWHEAGHAVAAHVLGADVTHVSLVPDPEDHSIGHTRYRPRRHAAQHQDACLITLAGPLAQGLTVWGVPEETLELHRRECHEFLLGDVLGLSAASRLAYLKFVEVAAADVVHRHWSAITRVAEALLRDDALTGDAIRALVAPPAASLSDAA